MNACHVRRDEGAAAWLEEEMKGRQSVFVEYNGRRWKLKQKMVMTYFLATMLERKPYEIAEPAPDFDWFAIANLAEVVRDCLEYNYSDYGYKNRGDCPTWRSQALLTLEAYAKKCYDDLDSHAKDPYFNINKLENGGLK